MNISPELQARFNAKLDQANREAINQSIWNEYTRGELLVMFTILRRAVLKNISKRRRQYNQGKIILEVYP